MMTILTKPAVKITAATLVLATLAACSQGGNTQNSPNNQSIQASQSAGSAMDHGSMNHASMNMSGENTAPHTQAYLKMMNEMGTKMSTAGNLADPDTAFVSGMVPHHIGAVEMAKIELEYGKDETMRKLAQAIIDGQQAEIDWMNGWLTGKDTGTQNPDAPHAKAYAQGGKEHEAMMNAINDPDPDIAFAKAMIPHHQGAVNMAKIELEYGKDEAVKKLARDIIKAQEPEIKLMQDWLKQKGQ